MCVLRYPRIYDTYHPMYIERNNIYAQENTKNAAKSIVSVISWFSWFLSSISSVSWFLSPISSVSQSGFCVLVPVIYFFCRDKKGLARDSEFFVTKEFLRWVVIDLQHISSFLLMNRTIENSINVAMTKNKDTSRWIER